MTATHLPFTASAHASHCPEQALSQQTPSTHDKLVHSDPWTHATPFVFSGKQTFDVGSQYCVVAQG